MADDKRNPTQTAGKYQFPPWLKKLMWWIVGIVAVVVVIATITLHAPKLSSRPDAVRRQESRAKEILGTRLDFNLKEGEWVGPIIRPDGWHWSADFYADKKFRMRLERRGKIIGEWDIGGGLPPVVTAPSRPGDEIFLTSLDGEQTATLQWVDRSRS